MAGVVQRLERRVVVPKTGVRFSSLAPNIVYSNYLLVVILF